MPEPARNPDRLPEWVEDIASGTLAGFGQTLVGHPLDTIKVRLQGTRSLELYNGRMTSLRPR